MVRIAESEWVIMKVLWKESPLTSRQIIDAIDNETDWNAKTIHTLISRLCKKNAIKAVRQDGTVLYNYYANVNEADCVKAETNHLLQRLYGGSLKKLVSTFAEDDSISKTDIKELREYLEKLEKGE